MSDTRAAARPTGCPTEAFYRSVVATLDDAGVPFLVGGAHAYARLTGLHRDTKDLDLFVRRRDLDAAFGALGAAGWRCELAYAHWLAKAHGGGGDFIDLVFSSGNGVASVDDEWFAHALPGTLFGRAVRLCPAEETLWSKAFVMERERYDGADVAHLLLARGPTLDWPRLLRRFGAHWRVLLAHLVLFGFAYPGERERVPDDVLQLLLARLRAEHDGAADGERTDAAGERVCAGTLLSRAQYLADVEQAGYRDARLPPSGAMAAAEVEAWTRAIPGREEPQP